MSTLRISICLLLLLLSISALAQDKEPEAVAETAEQIAKDSIKITNRYGLRLGADLSKLIRTTLDDEYKGFELMGDYRLTKRLYIAGEIGTEEKTTITEFLNSTANGSYFKAGIDYNTYDNWFGMENAIYTGFRVGASTFKQTINSYTIYNTNQYWEPQLTVDTPEEFSGLSALWTEFIVGLKAELLTNLYLGLNVQLKVLISDDAPNNFENLYIPGYNKTYDSGRFGVGYGYNISYLIPLYKKEK